MTDYIIQSGDTLYSISRRFDTTIDTLLRLNPWITDEEFDLCRPADYRTSAAARIRFGLYHIRLYAYRKG